MYTYTHTSRTSILRAKSPKIKGNPNLPSTKKRWSQVVVLESSVSRVSPQPSIPLCLSFHRLQTLFWHVSVLVFSATWHKPRPTVVRNNSPEEVYACGAEKDGRRSSSPRFVYNTFSFSLLRKLFVSPVTKIRSIDAFTSRFLSVLLGAFVALHFSLDQPSFIIAS